MKYYIRTTGERSLDESYEQIPYVRLIDSEHRYIDFFIDQLERLGNDDFVLIEDDCVLCNDFKKRIEYAISQYPNKIINFFQHPGNGYFKTHESNSYLMNQCTYYPKNLTKKLAEKMRKFHLEFPKLSTDLVENLALKELNETHIKYRPCLVQHLNFDSLLGHEIERPWLRTPFFIDYLNQLGFDYNNLNKKDIKKLVIKMKYHLLKKREEWLKQKELDLRINSIKYFIRTTGERKLDSTINQINYEPLIDKEHKPVKSFIEQLKIISNYDSVLLEDDVKLCKNFKKEIEFAIKRYPDKIINFFTGPKSYFKTKESNNFYFNQCTYYPKDITNKLAIEMEKIENENPGKLQYDVIESKALKNLGITHIQYRPCLVQHLDFKSLIGNNDSCRITPFFIDYLMEFNIDYDEANNHTNLLKLKYRAKKELEVN